MTLYELKQVFKNGVNTTDKKYDVLIYVNVQDMNERIAKMFKVIDIDIERVAPLQIDYVDFLKKHKTLFIKYLKETYTNYYINELLELNDDDFAIVVLSDDDIMHDFMNDEYDTIKDILK